jgi:putative membrane protein
MAAERTLMAWTRTSLSLISFGFGLYKFLKSVLQKPLASQVLRNDSPRNAGLALIVIGILPLTLACLQHWVYKRKLGLARQIKLVDLSFIVAALILLLGMTCL